MKTSLTALSLALSLAAAPAWAQGISAPHAETPESSILPVGQKDAPPVLNVRQERARRPGHVHDRRWHARSSSGCS